MFLCLTGWAQTRKAFVQAAEDAFASENYYAAMDYYLEAIEFDSTDVELTYRAGEAARNFDSYEKAEELYTYVIGQDSDGKYPYATYHLAHMQQMQGKYEQAKRNYELYLSQFEGDNPRFTDKARKEISSIDWSADRLANPEPNVLVSNMGEGVNTPFSEIGAIIDGSDVVYTSVRFLPDDRKKYSMKHIGKVLSYSETTAPVEYSEGFNKENHHTAHVTYNMNRSKMFYTVCEYINDDDIRCEIFCRAILGDGSLGEEIRLPDHINQDSFTTTQPNVGFDKVSGQEVLYFVSNRQGGRGGLDIWASNMTGVESFANPVNLTAVNSGGDDITPFFHNKTQVLYYSTDGEMSMGGYDVFRSIRDNNGYGRGQNVGAPINSSYNDVFYTLTEDSKTGLFSSNRPGSMYIDENNKSCCYDIYKADIDELEINLNALTFDAKSLDSLEGATVQLICVESGEVLNTMTNEYANDHIFSLKRGKEYMIVSSKRGYVTDTMRLNTNTIFSSEDVVRKIFLERSTLELQVFTFDQISREALPGTTVTLMDLTDGTIQEVTLTNENANDFLFDVIPGHSYRLLAQRDRFYPAEVEFVARDDDGSGIIRQELYLSRRDLNIYLPLALYFDNDIPNRTNSRVRTSALTTELSYTSTFDEYVVKKQEFKDKYARGLSGTTRDEAHSRVESFFEGDLKGGYDRYLRFMEYLHGQLQDGNQFEISLRGFASPRADTKYNLALSQRRVVSVQNEIREFKNGALVPYITNGQLKINELSFGESLAPDAVSDGLYDRRNSIYSPEASKERRTEIVEIIQGQ
jgi:WD40-like Beta Propeller Repeat.